MTSTMAWKQPKRSFLLLFYRKGLLLGAFTSFLVLFLIFHQQNQKRVAAPVLVVESSTTVSSTSSSVSSENTLLAIQDLHTALSKDRLGPLVKQFSKVYQRNLPFPHIAIDGIFPDSYLQLVLHELSEPTQQGCLPGSSQCFHEANQNKKSSISQVEKMGLYTQMLFETLKGSSFVQFLEALSGIEHLIPDPHFRGSGIHVTAPGGYLDIHADFNKYQDYNLDRRVNVFLYLNREWSDEDGGHLELWSDDLQTCYQRILPTYNRLVVFSSTDFSYHGHPQPLSGPQSRQSLALYYYTNGRPASECLNYDCSGKGHLTLFQTPVGCKRCEDAACRAFVE